MPVYAVPPDARDFAVVRGKDGSHAVADADRRLLIHCRDADQAADLADRLNRGDHDGTVQVDLLAARPEETSP